MKKSKSILAIIVIIFMLSLISIPVSARNGPFLTIDEAAGGRMIMPNPSFVDGGDGHHGEHSYNLFDGTYNTKYCASSGHMPFWAIWRYPEAFAAGRLLIATANDSAHHPRRPDNWTLYGSNDSINWTVLHEGSPHDIYHYNHVWFFVDLPGETAYQYYMFFSPYGYDGGTVQLARLELTGTTVGERPPLPVNPLDTTLHMIEEPSPPADEPSSIKPISVISVILLAVAAIAIIIFKKKEKDARNSENKR